MGFLRHLPTCFSIAYFGLAPRISNLLEYLRVFAIFGQHFSSRFWVADRSRLSHESLPIGVRSSEASGSSFPGLTNQRPARVGVAPLFGARRLFVDDGISWDFPSSYVMCHTRLSMLYLQALSGDG